MFCHFIAHETYFPCLTIAFSSWAKCLYDKPSEVVYDAWKFHGKPGISYTAKDQCEILLRDRDAYPFKSGQESKICENLHCRTPNRSGFFFAGPALPGTECGSGFWCDGGECVHKDISSLTTTTRRIFYAAQATTTTATTHQPTFSPWTNEKCKSECLKASKGVQLASRTCGNDAVCDGSQTNLKICDDKKLCPVRKTVVEYGTQKCREFSRRLVNVDSKGLGLQAFYEPLRLWMPCTIFCKHKNNTSYFTPRIELNKLGIDGYFPDGTWCHREGSVDYYCLYHHCLPEVS